MQPITITADMANSIWAYLATKPFAEVANLAVAYQQMVGPQIVALEEAAKAAAGESEISTEVSAEATA